MKRSRSVFLLILAIIVMQLLVSTAFAADSYQVLYGSFAEELWKEGLFLGSNGSFNLDKPLTRAAGATMLVRLLGKVSEAEAGTYSYPFTDVPDWAAHYVGYCYKNELIKGVSAVKYGSGNAMTAAQYLTLILRALGYKDGTDFTYNAAADKALEIGLIGESCHKQYTTTDIFMRDNAVIIAYNALNETIKNTAVLLRDTISMPGRPAGDMPAYTENQPVASDDSGTTSAYEVTVEREYAENGVLETASYYINGKEAAHFYDGGSGTIYNGDGWYMEITRETVGIWYQPPGPGSPKIYQHGDIFHPKLLYIRSEDKSYDLSSSQDWKKDAYIVKNNIEPVISFILDEMAKNAVKLRGSGYN